MIKACLYEPQVNRTPASNEERPIRRLGITRRALLEDLVDHISKAALPSELYAAEWRLRQVGIDYHVEIPRRTSTASPIASPAAKSRCG